jgi:hypothetical protein
MYPWWYKYGKKVLLLFVKYTQTDLSSSSHDHLLFHHMIPENGSKGLPPPAACGDADGDDDGAAPAAGVGVSIACRSAAGYTSAAALC